MKIVILSAAYPFRGGIANFTNLLAANLKQNNDVVVYTFTRQYPDLLFPGKTQMEPETGQKPITSIRTLDSINPLSWKKTGKLIKRENPDLLIFNFWMPFFAPSFGTVAKIVKKNSGVKTLAICHNIVPHESKPGDVFLTKYFLSKIDYFVLLSEKVKEELLKLKPRANYKVLFHPVYSSFGNAVSKKEAKERLNIDAGKVLLFFGLVREYKGLDVLLEAIAKVKNQSDVKLIVAGEFYDSKNKYLRMIKDLNIEQNVSVIDKYIESDEVKYYFSAADAVVLPYKEATQSGIVQVAVNFAKPLIGTTAGGLKEIIEDNVNGFLVQPGNPDDLANAIIKFYTEDKEEEFSANIVKISEKFSWQKFSGELLKLVNVNN